MRRRKQRRRWRCRWQRRGSYGEGKWLFSRMIFGALLCVVVFTHVPYGTVEPWWKAVFICVVLALLLIEIAGKGVTRIDPRSPVVPLLALTIFAFFQTQISADALQTKF